MEGSVGRHYTGAQPATDGGMTTTNTAALGTGEKAAVPGGFKLYYCIKIPPKLYV